MPKSIPAEIPLEKKPLQINYIEDEANDCIALSGSAGRYDLNNVSLVTEREQENKAVAQAKDFCRSRTCSILMKAPVLYLKATKTKNDSKF